MELRWGLITPDVPDAVFAGIRARLPIDNPRFATELMLQRCTYICSWWNEECLGAAFGVAPEIHLAFRPSAHGRWFSRRSAREFLTEYFRQNTLAIAREWTPAGQRVLEHLGFARLHDGYYLERSQYAAA